MLKTFGGAEIFHKDCYVNKLGKTFWTIITWLGY